MKNNILLCLFCLYIFFLVVIYFSIPVTERVDITIIEAFLSLGVGIIVLLAKKNLKTTGGLINLGLIIIAGASFAESIIGLIVFLQRM